jgi:hypothetical protein
VYTFPHKKNGTGYPKLCHYWREGKENIEGGGHIHSTTSHVQLSSLALDDCLQLLSMNKDSPSKLDAFVTIPGEKIGMELGVHDYANCLCDYLADTSDYH